jgi:hypothetical protein
LHDYFHGFLATFPIFIHHLTTILSTLTSYFSGAKHFLYLMELTQKSIAKQRLIKAKTGSSDQKNVCAILRIGNGFLVTE